MHGLLITRLKMQPFVVTLCGLLIYRGVARWYIDDSTTIGFGYGDDYDTLAWLASGQAASASRTPSSSCSIVAAIMGVVLHRSVFGRYLFAVGKNEEAARFSGINDRARDRRRLRHQRGSRPASRPSASSSTPTRSRPSSHGNFYELYAIAAAVLGRLLLRGGEGSILGIVLGTALLQVLQNLVNILGIPSSLNFAVMGAVILLGVLADQQLQRRRARQVALAGYKAAKAPVPAGA